MSCPYSPSTRPPSVVAVLVDSVGVAWNHDHAVGPRNAPQGHVQRFSLLLHPQPAELADAANQIPRAFHGLAVPIPLMVSFHERLPFGSSLLKSAYDFPQCLGLP